MNPRRLPVVLGLAAAFACAEGFAPGARINLAIVPVFSDAVAGVLTGDLDQLRVRVRRVPSNALVIDTTVAVDSAGNIDLPLTVPLLADPERFEILLEGVRSTDAIVLYSGIDTVSIAAGSSTPPPVQLPISYVGPCQPASGCQVTLGPPGATLAQGDSVLLTTAVDSLGVPKTGVPVSLVNLDTSLVRVRASRYVVARTGTAGGQARVVGQIRSDADTLFITVTSQGSPAIGLSSGTAAFSATQGGTNPAAQTINVSNTSVGTLTGLGIGTITYGGGATGWLGTSYNTTTAPAVLTLSATTGSLAAGTYTATVPVTSAVASNSPQTINVTFTVNPGPPAAIAVTPGYAAIRTTTPNQTVQLAASVQDAFGNNLTPALTWTSRNPAAATVSAGGLVSGVAQGSAVIVATAGTVSDSTIVTVGNGASAPGDMLVAAVTNGRAFGVRRVGQPVTVDIRVDQLATGDSLGSYNARYSWNPAVLRFDSTSAGTYASPTVNDSSSIGVLRFAAVDANSKSGPLVLTRLWFTALSTGNDGHALQISEISGVSPAFFNYFANNRYVLVSGNARITP